LLATDFMDIRSAKQPALLERRPESSSDVASAQRPTPVEPALVVLKATDAEAEGE
jgi:hypothetical protein